MKILGICGSPRKGNTEFMLKTVLDAAKSKGAETELILLREKKIKHCKGCLSCDKKKACVIKDDMQQIYKKLEKADLVVIGTPNYFENVPGLLKDFIDRTNPYYETNKLKDKKIAFLVVGGGDIVESERVTKVFKPFIECHKLVLLESFIFKGLNSDEVKKNKDELKRLKEIGECLL